MNKRSGLYFAIGIAYLLLLIVPMYYFNHMRATEYSYSYDFRTFALNASQLAEDGSSIRIDETSGFQDMFADPPGAQLNTGDYMITIKYESDSNHTMHLAASSNLDQYITLPADQTEVSEQFTIWPATDHFKAWLIYSGVGALTVYDMTITSMQPIYTDYEYYMIVTVFIWILIPVALLIMWKKYHFTKEQWIISGILVALGIISSFPIFYGYLWQGTDTRPHLMRMDGISRAFSEHRIPTMLYPNYCNDYGEVSCIYPDKFLYIPGLLRNRGVSLLSSLGTILLLINFAALLIMYYCAKYVTKSSRMALLASVLFCFFPYREFVMYEGGAALGMGVALLFFPLLYTALYDVFFLAGKRWYLLTISIAGLLCSHILSLALGMILAVITVVFCLLVLWKTKGLSKKIKGIVLSLLKSVGAFFAVCLSTIVPFVYYYSQGLSVDTMKLQFSLSIKSFAHNFLSESGQYHLILLVLSIVFLIIMMKKKISPSEQAPYYTIYYVFLIVMGFGLFWMSTNLFPWSIFYGFTPIYKALNMFQFAERFMLAGMPAICLGFIMLTEQLYGSIDECHDQQKRKMNIGMIVLMIIAVLLGCNTARRQIGYCDVCVHDRMTGNIYYKQSGYLPAGTDISFYASTVPNCGDWDSVENISYIKNGTSIHYEYICSSENNYIEFPLFNYSGYHAYDANGNELEIINSEHNRIQLNLIQNEEPQTIDVCFKMHPVFCICAIISSIATIFLYGYIIKKNKKEANRA